MKKNKVNDFLKNLYAFYQQNENLNEEHVRFFLIYYNTNRTEINHLFPKWIDYFKNRQNINVFVASHWQYFCQFTNNPGRHDKLIKLYVPLKETHIEEGAKIIFNYLSDENIHHLSKIGSHSRCDDLVIRVDSLNDAKKIINFVKRNKYLKQGLLETNPFTPNIDGVGLTLDAGFSYNSEISKVLHNFMMSKLKEKKCPTCEDLVNYIIGVINNTDSHYMKIMYLILYLQLTKKHFDMDLFMQVVDKYQENDQLLERSLYHTKLKHGEEVMLYSLLKMMENDFSYVASDDHLRENAQKYLSGEQIKSIINKRLGNTYSKKIDRNSLVKYINECVINIDSGYIYTNALLNAFRETAKIKGYDKDMVLRLLQSFLVTKNYSYLTRTNGIRESIVKMFDNCNSILELIINELEIDPNTSVYNVANILVEKMYIDEKRR